MHTPANSKTPSKDATPTTNINIEPPSSNTSLSTSATSDTLSIDPYQNSRARPADGSFRHALTAEECHAAEERLMGVCGLETLQRYLGEFPGSLGGGEPFNTTARYWHGCINRIEETRDRVIELDSKEIHLTEALNIMQQEIGLIKSDKKALEDYGRDAMRYVRQNLWQVKAAIKEAQKDLRRSDERDLREAARQDGRKLCILPPADSNPDVRPFTNEELGTRMTARCTKCGQFGHWWNDHHSIKCGQFGHWWNDHHSIKCPHCENFAPGHSPNHCPKNPHRPTSTAAEDGSQGSWRGDTEPTGWGTTKESGWGSWNSEKIDDGPWMEWKERQERQRREKKNGEKPAPLGNGWDPIANNTEEHWLSPTEAEKKRAERRSRRQTRFLLTPGDKKAIKTTRLRRSRRLRKPDEDKEAGEWSQDDWEENLSDDAYGNMDF